MAGTEAVGQLPAVALEVGDHDRLDTSCGQRGDGRQPDGSRADHDRKLPGRDTRHGHVALADGKRVAHRDRVRDPRRAGPTGRAPR